MTSRALVGFCIGLLLGTLSTATDARAQPRPGTVQPGQIERQFERPPEPTARPGAITIPEASQPRPANADTLRFVVNQLTVDGVTAYPAEKLRSVYAGVLQKEVSLSDIYQIVDALTARYRNDGYILSQVIVPAQSVENGAIRLQAIEGYIADVRVEGSASAAVRERVRRYGEKIRASRPLTAATLERYVLLMNDLPGITAHAVLAPGSLPGASDLVLQVGSRPAAAALTSDNRGSRAQGPQRALGDADLNGLIGASLTEIRGVSSFDRELVYVAASHDQFLGPNGGKLGIAGSYVYSRPQELAVIPLDLTTNSQTVTVSYTYPLIRRRARNLYLRGTVSAFDSRSDIFGLRDTADRVRAARVGATFDAADGLRGVSIVDFEFSHGFGGLNASKNGDPYLSRPTGRTDFRKATLYAARMQALPANWSIVLAGNAQYAFTDLLAPELFSFGGEQFGRGYDPSELLNDHGAALKLDLRYTHTWSGTHPTALTPYGFVDGGRVWQRTPLAGLPTAEHATSAGIGMRLNIGTQLSGFIEVAKPLDRIVGQQNNRDPRVYAGLSIQ